MEDIKKETLRFITANLLMGASRKEIADHQSFLELGVLDSTGVIELIAFLEETFGIHVEDEEIVPENLDSLASIERYVSGKIASLRAPMPAVSLPA